MCRVRESAQLDGACVIAMSCGSRRPDFVRVLDRKRLVGEAVEGKWRRHVWYDMLGVDRRRAKRAQVRLICRRSPKACPTRTCRHS